jgi:hypothetical protein
MELCTFIPLEFSVDIVVVSWLRLGGSEIGAVAICGCRWDPKSKKSNSRLSSIEYCPGEYPCHSGGNDIV